MSVISHMRAHVHVAQSCHQVGGGGYEESLWHQNSEGPLGQYRVNRPNKVVDYV